MAPVSMLSSINKYLSHAPQWESRWEQMSERFKLTLRK